MANSELAESICTAYFNNTEGALLRDVIDAELQEMRGVLSQTADRRYSEDSHGHCWCKKDLTDDKEPHSQFCLRARALWERLTVKGRMSE